MRENAWLAAPCVHRGIRRICPQSTDSLGSGLRADGRGQGPAAHSGKDGGAAAHDTSAREGDLLSAVDFNQQHGEMEPNIAPGQTDAGVQLPTVPFPGCSWTIKWRPSCSSTPSGRAKKVRWAENTSSLQLFSSQFLVLITTLHAGSHACSLRLLYPNGTFAV